MSKNHYISNKDLFAAYCVFIEQCNKNKESGLDRPPIPNELGTAFLQIATKLSTKFNFVNYSYRDEMISDAVLKMCAKAHNFDPSKSNNIFGFLSQISWNSFVERIKSEKHQQSVRARLIREKMSNEFIEHAGAIDDLDTSNAFVEFLKENDVIVDHYEEQQKSNKIHPSLVHRNKTPYPVKSQEVLKEPKEIEVDIFAL